MKSRSPARLALLGLLGLAGCGDALMARNLPPAQDCRQRGGTWRVTPDGHTGLCTLPPGAGVAGARIVPRHRNTP
ncbi:hypothetical protein CFR75_08820 [Komagataeibacter xylinus]|uniref:Uncharacterized protein n=1 Tax=Komagataeibacter xylinus TaxID=28448 RepID=A0A318PHZ5_KOMXY|nr:hypothetical protein [Komagataeibacter xylinus]AZV37864.1 hypothetical protein CXP35_02590 [Komagataeibacter xylinus]PYD56884.1 hypothetical protein CFR75_08820 [Komagataeibacter xylinus]GBQ70159.1 hypothetical protein AA15237_0800 [Komagataeibacter xylinus NBRC 15237]